MNVTIIGPGAIGIFIAQRLVRLGAQVGFIGRGGPCAVRETFLASDGLFDVSCEAPSARDIACSDVMFVVVKAFHLEAALRFTRGVAKGTPVVVTVNGAVHQIVQEEMQRSPDLLWRFGSCTFGVSRTPLGQFEQRSKRGDLMIGPQDPALPSTSAEQELIRRDPEVFSWHPEMVQIYRRKWLFNTVINTLCAVNRLPRNGALLDDMPGLEGVFAEAYRLGLEMWGPWVFSRQTLYQGVVSLIRETAANENSMARDVRLGRRTESAYLAGLAKDSKVYPLLTDYHARIMTSMAASSAPLEDL